MAFRNPLYLIAAILALALVVGRAVWLAIGWLF